jgi:hypothetical protein
MSNKRELTFWNFIEFPSKSLSPALVRSMSMYVSRDNLDFYKPKLAITPCMVDRQSPVISHS